MRNISFALTTPQFLVEACTLIVPLRVCASSLMTIEAACWSLIQAGHTEYSQALT